ncbi:hypothetical protein BGZ54_005899, partial [Gamsiella multidivaricata]
ATVKEYGSFDKIKSIKSYLKFLVDTPGALDGTRTDHTLWFIKKYDGKIGAQAAERAQGKTRTENEDKAAVHLQNKRLNSNEDHGRERG